MPSIYERIFDLGPDPCKDCGICCEAGMTIELGTEELLYLAAAGSHFRSPNEYDMLSTDYVPAPGTSLWVMTSDCGNLDPLTRKCMDYKNRPTACRSFAVGGLACQSLRVFIGMPLFPPRERGAAQAVRKLAGDADSL